MTESTAFAAIAALRAEIGKRQLHAELENAQEAPVNRERKQRRANVHRPGAALAVSDGRRRHLGWILRRASELVVFDRDGNCVGSFATLAAALRALPSAQRISWD